MEGKNIVTKKSRDVYPLSPMQEALLFQVLYSPGSGVNIEQSVYPLSGPIDVEVFRLAWQQAADRHPALRTFFLWKKLKNPVQVANEDLEINLAQLDWRTIAAGEQEKKLQQWLRADRRREFELSEPPLLRFTLIRMGEQDHTFVWSWHHMLMDGWSASTVMEEVFTFYRALSEGKRTELPRSRPFRDYIAWLQRQSLSEAETYWRKALAGLSVSDHSATHKQQRLTVEDIESESDDSIFLSAEVTAALQNAARQSHITLNALVQGALGILLSRYYGQGDITFGELVSGRPAELEGIQSMVGFFLNVLPVRVKVDEHRDLGTWLQRLQANQAEARRYDYTPLFKLREWSGLPLAVPLFNVVLIFQNISAFKYSENGNSSLLPAGLQVRSAQHYGRVDSNQIALIVVPDEQLLLRMISDPAHIDSGTAKGMLSHFKNLLEAIAENADRKIYQLNMMSDDERQQVLRGWNSSDFEGGITKCIHQLFEEQVERTPDAVAVVDSKQALSYRELNRRANMLARQLQGIGVGLETRVAVYLERSVDLLVSLLGILKAGGAYLPLDAKYPAERLKFMMSDAGAVAVVTRRSLVNSLPEQNLRLLCLDEMDQDDRYAENSQTGDIKSDNLAYVIYTSGSTGIPKGVGITHGNAAAMVLGTRDEFSREWLGKMLASTSICFDLSVFEIFVPLSVGATVALMENALEITRIDPGRVTFLNTVPSLMVELVRIGWKAEGMPVVALAGEALRRGLVDDLYEKCGVERVYNLYGPTEDTTYSTVEAVRRDDQNEPSIGRALRGGQVYVLDSRCELVPAGAIGEIYLGGAGLARGYLGRPDLTAERFIPNPYSEAGGERLYKTGDQARYVTNAGIEFIGRVDHQVKLRGLRIELGEIESILIGHPGVRQAVVLDREGKGGDLRLVAFIVGDWTRMPTTEQVRSYLRKKLPEYSVPGRFVLVDEIPLTPNGKVNRAALLQHDTDARDDDARIVGPSDLLELQLIHLWETVLNVRPIGVTDNFVDLGGHSFLAIRLVAQMHKQFGEVIDLPAMLELGTIANIAKVLHGKVAAPSYSPLVAIQPKGLRQPFFCVHGIGGQVFGFYAMSRHLGENQPFYGLQSHLVTEEVVGKSIEETAAEYLQAIRTVQPEGPYLLGGYSFGGVVAFEMAQQLTRETQEVASVILLDTTCPLIMQQFPHDDEDECPYMSLVLRERAREMGKDLTLSADILRVLNPDDRFMLLFKVMKENGLIEDDTSQETAEAYIRGIIKQTRARNNAVRRYKPEVFRGKITSIQCADRAMLIQECETWRVSTDESRYGWTSLSTEPVDIYETPGSHETIIEEPHVKDLAERILTSFNTPLALSLTASQI
jgi:amino acid adenylation domain-containing protein